MNSSIFWINLSLFFLLLPAHGKSACQRTYEIGTIITTTDHDQDSVARIYVDILNEIQKRHSCAYTERLVSLSRASEELRNHRIDIFAFAFPNDSWDAFASHLPLFSVKRLLLVQKKHFVKGATIQDYLNNAKVNFGVLSGTTFLITPKEIVALEKHKRVQFLPFPEIGVDFFTKNKVDAVFFNPIMLPNYVEKFQLHDKAMLVIDAEEPPQLSIFFSKKRISLAELKNFENILTSMKKDGALKNILRNYVNEGDIKDFYKF